MHDDGAKQVLAALALAHLNDKVDSEVGDVTSLLDALLLAAAKSRTSLPANSDNDSLPDATEAPVDQSSLPGAKTDSPTPLLLPETGLDSDTPGSASVWLSDDGSAHTIPGKALSIGRVSALPNALEIARALRPLRHLRPSRVHRRLDIAATVDHYTRTGMLVPRLAPAPEPWLDVVVVQDRGTAMTVWDETVRSLAKVLHSLSAFRDVHIWHLEHPTNATPILRDHCGRALPMDPSDARQNQPAHRLVLVVSDCAAPAWRQNALWQTLHTWGRTAPIALINPLPKRLWQRSGLDLPRTTATAPTPACPGHLLAYGRPRLLQYEDPGTQPWQALPVMGFAPDQMLAWAHTLMRTDPKGCEAVLIPASGRMPPRGRERLVTAAAPSTTAADAQFTTAASAFTDEADSPAARLAIAAASLDAFTIPILDVLRERMVPEATLADTAEFLTAGLLTATRHGASDIVYRFHPAAASHLRGLLNRDQAWDAYFALTDHLAAHPQAPHGITATLSSPESQVRLPAGLQPIAQAAAATARLLGVELTEPNSGANRQASPQAGLLHNEEADDGPQSSPLAALSRGSKRLPDTAVAPDGRQADATVEIKARAMQRDMLERLNAERDIHGRHRNLLVAATGTGKTVMAALDYQHLRQKHQRDLRLLFIASSAEILHQSVRVYQEVLGDAHFGESLHSGMIPRDWTHVFASVQSLTARSLDDLAPDHFDVIVIDEFHHATSPTYRKILDHFEPMELLGLTATPERADGMNVHDQFFDGRIAAEMRLWEALENGMVCPIHYFGISDGTDLQAVAWHQGAYDPAELSAMISDSDARARIIIEAVLEKVADPTSMRALAFCMSVRHARFMAEFFRHAGFNAIALTAETPLAQRQHAIFQLKDGELQIIFCVDLFSGGISIPEVDTLLFLRPYRSTTRFLQDIGTGLRLSPGKSVLTVLDFIGQPSKEFRFDQQFRALTNSTGKHLIDQVERNFPHLPTGCQISLDAKAKRIIVDNVKEQMGGSITRLTHEVARYGELELDPYLKESGRELSELYRGNTNSWTSLLRRSGLLKSEGTEREGALLRRLAAFLHVDDPYRSDAYTRMLADDAPRYSDLNERDQAYARMLFFQLWPLGGPPNERFTNYEQAFTELRQQPAVRSELRQILAYNTSHTARITTPRLGINGGQDIPLNIHASYSREEILSALGQVQIDGPMPGNFAQGVHWCKSVSTDMLLITLERNKGDFSPRSRFRDYALTRTLFHWESQNATSETSSTGIRYQNHIDMGSSVLLFIRQYKSNDIGRSQPWTLLGPAEYVQHTGSQPMAITWKLSHELPADVWSYAGIS
ncbi:DUF3427 domain-containing protein [Streptomyces sp. NPDC086554]|uniref:DUF3427 domain-containing protein n=1 Tax=Streptomyces sp. NPDC086554 TaxID=3154864 RepID=UPI00343DDD41